MSVASKDNLAPAVFFDRDGTLMEEVDYCRRPEDVRVFAGVVSALRGLRSLGWRCIVITNQSGLARGRISWADYARVSHEFLRQCDFLLDATYFCPDAPDTAPARRKPAQGMLEEAIRDWRIDRSTSWMIGDKPADLQCGRAAGVRSLLVRTGYGATTASDPGAVAWADGVFDDAPAALAWLVSTIRSKRGASLA